MCCEADWWVPSSKYGLPLTAAGDSCRTSRLALTSIARVRPAVFITSISKEIARYNNLGNFTIFYTIAISRVFLRLVPHKQTRANINCTSATSCIHHVHFQRDCPLRYFHDFYNIAISRVILKIYSYCVIRLALTAIARVHPAVFITSISKEITLISLNNRLLLKIKLFYLVFRPEGHRAYPQGGSCS